MVVVNWMYMVIIIVLSMGVKTVTISVAAAVAGRELIVGYFYTHNPLLVEILLVVDAP
jgi:hypothetical protein